VYILNAWVPDSRETCHAGPPRAPRGPCARRRGAWHGARQEPSLGPPGRRVGRRARGGGAAAVRPAPRGRRGRARETGRVLRTRPAARSGVNFSIRAAASRVCAVPPGARARRARRVCAARVRGRAARAAPPRPGMQPPTARGRAGRGQRAAAPPLSLSLSSRWVSAGSLVFTIYTLQSTYSRLFSTIYLFKVPRYPLAPHSHRPEPHVRRRAALHYP
jgi:hypothetical protein